MILFSLSKSFMELNMELTLDQALQQGIEAHKAGQLQEADRLYTAILKAQPKHPDANHNMGVLAVGVGKVQEALPFFKIALEVNPNADQFWLSYIDALIKLDKLADAKAMLDQAKSKGAKGDGFDQLEQTLNVPSGVPFEAVVSCQEMEQVQPNILDNLKLDQVIKLAKNKSKEGSDEEAKRIYQDVLVKFPKNKRAIDGLKGLAGVPAGKASKVQDPPQDQQQSLINLYSQGQLQQALAQATVLLEQFPNSSVLYNICGAVYKGLGQLDASVEAYNKALDIKPDYAEAYNNMGNALQEQGKLEEAIEAFDKALSLEPDYADAYYNMGIALHEQRKLKEAIEAYKKALALKPDNAEAYYNMGNTLRDQGMLEEAIETYNKALAIKPDSAKFLLNLSNAKGKAVPLWHIPMMNEHGRNEAYQKAMHAAIRGGDVVLDIGTGAGLLSMIAADCGAKEIITCEMSTTISKIAEKIIQKNGFDHKIRVINKNSKDLILGQDINKKVDILVSEILSSEFVGEGIQTSVLDAKKRLLKKTGKMIPEGGSIMIALIENTGKLAKELFVDRALGYDIRDFNFTITNKLAATLEDEPVFLSDPIEAFTFDFCNLKKIYTDTKTIKIEVNRAGVCAGVIQWLKVQLYDDIEYQNNPVEMYRSNSVSGWKTPIFRFDDPVKVTKGQPLNIQATLNEDYSWFHLER